MNGREDEAGWGGGGKRILLVLAFVPCPIGSLLQTLLNFFILLLWPSVCTIHGLYFCCN